MDTIKKTNYEEKPAKTMNGFAVLLLNILAFLASIGATIWARMYPYDIMEEDSSNEKTLRGSSQEIAEIAAAMLQRQQAEAVVAARGIRRNEASAPVTYKQTDLHPTRVAGRFVVGAYAR